jgi:outer membrane receptor for ferrienterochelin and colicin
MMRKCLNWFGVVPLALILLSNAAIAQTSSGKIAGRVLDVDSGEPIIGANVALLNTSLGASTNIDGEYVILNIVPGNYSVRVTYVGYQPQVVSDVRVVAGVTKALDLKIKASAVELADIVITAEKKFFEEKATNDVRVYDSKEVSNLPVRGVEKVLSIQAGVASQEGSGGVDGNSTVNVRGGRGNEVLYVVDGVPQNDLLTGENYAQVSQNAIEQVSFQVGGYEAKYGQAQSAIVNVTTKTGSPKYSIFGDVLSSSFTDDFGYNLYSGTISGPIVPGIANHTLFVSAERGWFADGNPSAIGLEIPTKGISSKKLPSNEASVWRFTGRSYHDVDFITLRLGANINFQNTRTYIHSYSKNNSEHNPRIERKNYSFTARLSRPLTKSSFFNINLGYKRYFEEEGDGVHFDQLERYGDPAYNPGLTVVGGRLDRDPVGVFFAKGRISNNYEKIKNDTYTGDIDISAQLDNHLIEIGGGVSLNRLRYYNVGPRTIAIGKDSLSLEQRSRNAQPTFYGFDVTSQRETGSNEVDPLSGLSIAPNKPVIMYAYLQDRYELKDLVINVGLRLDYLDSKANILKDESLPFYNGKRDTVDPADFEKATAEVIFSPRIGLGFPVTPTTVFHAQFGKFVQQPRLIDLYTTAIDVESQLVGRIGQGVNTGRLKSEETTQYELGLRQILGDNAAALNITLFYKNTRNLVNDGARFYYATPGGERLQFYGPTNTDFGTVKGMALTLDVSRIKHLFVSLNYTYSIAEGTGSSTTSSTVAAFRNQNGEIPVVIAPLDFDQRHTGTLNVGFSTGKDELGILENVSANMLVNFASGRPYTPLQSQNILASIFNFGQTKGYVNSATGPGNFSVSLKVEKAFYFGSLSFMPYVWFENLFGARNAIQVYRSTGDPYTTGYLTTPEGIAVSSGKPNYVSDYKALERDPANFGIPFQMRIGFKVNFSGIEL